MRVALVGAICATALAPALAQPAAAAEGAAGAQAHDARSTTVRATNGRFVATLRAPTHSPRANRGWTITVLARSRSGRAVRATAFYRFLYNGHVVSTQYPSPRGPDRHSPWPFRGSYRDRILWPSRSVGYPLTFRVVVSVKRHGHVNLDYRVRVRR